MTLTKTGYEAVVIITIVVSVIGLVMSPVSAAHAFSYSGDTSGIPSSHSAPHYVVTSTQQKVALQKVVTNLGKHGVDVSKAQADLAAGNVSAAMKWMVAYNKAHTGHALNAPRQHVVTSTQQKVALQKVVANLGKHGVDVSKAQADLAAGNVSTAMKWLMTYQKDHHPGLELNSSLQHVVTSTQQAANLQKVLTNLNHHGANVNQAQADLATGNMNAAMKWMVAYNEVHLVQNGNRNTSHGGNSTQLQRGELFRPHSTGSGNQTQMHS